MTEFVVDFGRSVEELTRFQLGMTALGKQMDKLETNSNKSATAASKLFSRMESEYKRLEESLAKSGVDVEKLGSVMERVRGETAKLMSGVAAANLRATAATQAYNGELAELQRLMQDTASKNAFVASQQRIAQTNQTLINQNNELRAKIGARDSAEAKLNSALKQQLSYLERLSTEQQRAGQAYATAERQLQSLNGEQAQDTEILKSMIAGRKQQITENTRLDYSLQQLERTMRGLNGGTQEQIELARVAVNAKKAEVTETAREDAQLKQLQRTLTSLSGGRQEEIARVQAQITARRRAISEAASEKKVVDELAAAIAREESALVRLQAQAQLSSTSHGQRIAQLKSQIAEQTRYNQLLAMSTSSLLGLSNGQRRVNVSQELGSQAAAMLRAGLTGLHASVGMYTSATVLAATATYGISAALRDSVITGAEFSATMSRTEAIMSSVPSWMKDSSMATKAMEMQVRALGQTTVFTASEVGEGLQQLGMAGFNSSQAMQALPGTLTLANLANVSMARSADIATNVLMTFNMQAKDLTGVVDLMATAVNNSNTDIEQLANALSYAGPAAQTAGISLKDTVAAIEALANSGIKGSRAGSALRRLFVSLLNPTKKGSEVIRKYGLDIVDAEGKTRSLTNIIGQLSRALKDVPGPERLAAIQDLVGVYATSPIAALVDQADNFQKFRNQNENTAGAGKRMEEIISDNLKFDWKEMLSALEEVQLQAFDSMGMKLREITAGLTVSILELMEPVKTIGDVDITGLDQLMARAQTAAESIAYLVGGIVAYKFATGSVFQALAADAAGASTRLGILSQRAQVTSAGMIMMSTSANTARTSMDFMTAAGGRAAGALGGMATAGAVAAGALSKLATGMGLLMRGLGWVGLIYGIGSALYEVFSSDTDQKVLDHKSSVDDVKSSYEELKQQIEETGLARQRAAAKLNIKAQQASVDQLQGQILTRRNQINQAEQLGLSPDAIKVLKTDLANLEGQVGEYQTRVADAKEQLSALGTTTVDYTSAVDEQGKALSEVISLTQQLTLAQANLAATSRTGINNLKGQSNVGRLQAELDLARSRFDSAGRSVVQVQNNAPTVASLFDKFDQDAQAQAEEAAYKKTATVSQKLLDLDVKRNEELAVRARLVKQDEEARARGGDGPGLQIIEASNKRLLGIDKERLELQAKQADQQQQLHLAQESAAAASRSDSENQAALKERLVSLDRDLAKEQSPEAGKAVDLERVTQLYREQAQVRQQLGAIEKREGRSSRKETSDSTRELEQAQRAYDTLAKKVDPVTSAQRELEKATRAMNLLRQEGRITMAQEGKALGELNLQYYEAVKAADKNYAALMRVRQAYANPPFSAGVEDLAVMNAALNRGAVSLKEYSDTYYQILKKQKEEATSGLPKANLQVGLASSSPFTDWVSTEIERAQGLKQFEERQKELEIAEGLQNAANDRELQAQIEQLNAKKLNAETHAQEMLEIEGRYNENKLAIIQSAGQRQNAVSVQMAQYAEQMNTMALAAAMGSVSNILGMFASVGEEATTAQKAAFIAQKAIAVAQIIMFTELGAAQAIGIAGPFGIPLATFIRATGYANAGLVAALAIGDIATGGRVSTASKGTGGGAQMYDTGGFIPYNRTGIVGEYGPELVTGPAHVRGRGATKSTMGGGGGGDTYNITLAPQITVEGGGATATESDGKQVAQTIKVVTMNTLQEAIRPQGLLDTWIRSRKG